VTETVFLGRGAEHVETVLRTLCEEGVRIALDDFGTGYASLSHLKQFPVDAIKIDQSFVRDLAENPDDTAILFAVLNLGHNLGIDTIAEGIETEVQAEFLRAQGCDMGQGYLFGKAKPASDIPILVTSWAPERHGARPQRQSHDPSGLDWA
jgi:EAL domain-containing protein (putative c-di-GMP-specific phosphodiesterase class I)